MGGVFSDLKNPCVSYDEPSLVPKFHFKSRYDSNDDHSKSQIYTRTNDIKKYPVPRDKIRWKVEYPDYLPTEYTSNKILLKDGKLYKDPHVDEPEYKNLAFNLMDFKYGCDRQSHHGPYVFIRYKNNLDILVPCNPVGRTGLIGRGHLGRWGPNHAADPIVTRWRRNTKGEISRNEKTNKQILQFVAIQRKDTKEWALPGGMRDPGEKISRTLVREFAEEALNLNNEIEFDKIGRIMSKNNDTQKQKLNLFFRGGTMIYKGYVDDPRNTDNAWMETIACNFHDKKGDIVGTFKLEGGDDAENAKWMDLDGTLNLFASHKDFLREVANLHDAHW